MTFVIFYLSNSIAYALQAELNLGYNYLRRSFDELNWFANQATTAGVSVFLGESLAIELAYTNGLYIKKERESASVSSTAQRTTTQYTNSYDLGVIFLLSGRQGFIQPYLRLGGAYIERKQEVQIDNDIPFSIIPTPAFSPSGGVGLRIILSEKFAIRMAFDSIQTPIENNQFIYDMTGRVGLTWML